MIYRLLISGQALKMRFFCLNIFREIEMNERRRRRRRRRERDGKEITSNDNKNDYKSDEPRQLIVKSNSLLTNFSPFRLSNTRMRRKNVIERMSLTNRKVMRNVNNEETQI